MPRGKTKEKVVKAVEKTEKVAKKEVEKIGIEAGKITHYFDKIGVAVVEVSKDLEIGDLIRIKGTCTDFKQEIKSMQIEHQPIVKAKKGQAIGLKVEQPVREHDRVYKIEK